MNIINNGLQVHAIVVDILIDQTDLYFVILCIAISVIN